MHALDGLATGSPADDGRPPGAGGARALRTVGPTEPLTKQGVVDALGAVGVRLGDTVLVHSSLRALGFVVGGAQAAVDALLEAVGRTGTIVVPTHSDPWSEPKHWDVAMPDEWLDTIRSSMPPFHPRLTPTTRMGAVVECMRRYPGFRRSWHPRVSFGGIGRQIDELLADHPVPSGFGEHSPLGKLYAADAKIVLLGVGHASSSALHLAEHRAVWPAKRWIDQGASMTIDGRATWVTWRELDDDSSDFGDIGTAIAAAGIERVVPVGSSEVRMVSLRSAVDLGVEWIETHRAERRVDDLTPHPDTPARTGEAPGSPRRQPRRASPTAPVVER
jgi:aminoglycoside 3-N-acetyltransferase